MNDLTLLALMQHQLTAQEAYAPHRSLAYELRFAPTVTTTRRPWWSAWRRPAQ